MTQDMIYPGECSMSTWEGSVFCCFWMECPSSICFESPHVVSTKRERTGELSSCWSSLSPPPEPTWLHISEGQLHAHCQGSAAFSQGKVPLYRNIPVRKWRWLCELENCVLQSLMESWIRATNIIKRKITQHPVLPGGSLGSSYERIMPKKGGWKEKPESDQTLPPLLLYRDYKEKRNN